MASPRLLCTRRAYSAGARVVQSTQTRAAGETMSEKQVTLEDLARAEAAAAEQRVAKKQAYLDGQKKLQTLTPERFYTFARQLKEGVTRFNGAAKLERILKYTESTAVTV